MVRGPDPSVVTTGEEAPIPEECRPRPGALDARERLTAAGVGEREHAGAGKQHARVVIAYGKHLILERRRPLQRSCAEVILVDCARVRRASGVADDPHDVAADESKPADGVLGE